MLTYEHVCCMLMKLSKNENKTEMKIKSIPKFVQIMSGGIAGKKLNDSTMLFIDF